MSWTISQHVTIYREEGWYAAHPSVVRTPAGDIMAFFHRYGDLRCSHHGHPLFHVCACRSGDQGQTWTGPEAVLHNPRGGIGDFGVHTLPDDSLFLHGSTNELVPEEASDAQALWQGASEHGDTLPQAENERRSDHNHWKTVFGPPIWSRSVDNGRQWNLPQALPPIPDAMYGRLAPHCGGCRSGVLALADGRLIMPSKATDKPDGGQPYFGMIRVSKDMGRTWEYGGRIAEDPVIHFSEPTIHQTPTGRILVLFRCHLPAELSVKGNELGEHGEHRQPQLGLVVSEDGGKTWSDVHITPIQGAPPHMLALRDGRIFLTYGTRWPGQQGCCARVLDPEASDLETAEVLSVRSDSFGFPDCGYPWSVQLDDRRVLTIYYFVHENHLRGIEGTIVEEVD